MSMCQQTYRRCASWALVLAVVVFALPAVMNAQEAAPPKEELFVGYQWLNPGGDVPDNSNPPVAFKLPSIAPGAGVSFAYNFDKMWALEADWGTNQNSTAAYSTGMIGPKMTFRQEDLNLFLHTLFGMARLTDEFNRSHTNLGAALGGGIDLKLFWKPITLRLFEADYMWSQQHYSNVPLDDLSLRHSKYDGVRLRTGVIFNIGGGAPEVPVAATCSVQNATVMVGEPVHATVAASNFNPKHTLTYNWTSNGGKLEGKDTGATIDTNGMNAGDYSVTATVTDPKAKKNNMASCTSKFTVKPLNPPQISCSASPSSVQAPTPATITCTCTSPDGVPVTVGGWSSSGGSISGMGNSATLNTSGASPGTITVNATCTDSRGLTASASSSVTIQNPPPPPPPPAPQASKLNECEYPNVNKPWRVDNTCKAALDDVAAKLQQDPEAKLVVVGNQGPKEKRKNLAGERAVDVKAYLTGGEAKQSIDPSRIECRTANEGTMNSEQWIIPAGATFPEAGTTTPVDEKKIKPIPDHPKPAAKKAAKKAG